jgi:hypothetical protein
MLTRLFTSISNVLDINVATMSGCNDIIVIPHLDGSLKSTPFHVRFGKSKILRSRQRKVNQKERWFFEFNLLYYLFHLRSLSQSMVRVQMYICI